MESFRWLVVYSKRNRLIVLFLETIKVAGEVDQLLIRKSNFSIL